MGLHNFMNNLGGSDEKTGTKKANLLQHWVPSRHNNFYTWICEIPMFYVRMQISTAHEDGTDFLRQKPINFF